MKATIFLSEKKKQIQTIKETVIKDFEQLPLAIINWQPTPEKWSIAQCLEHLNIYCDYYITTMKDLMGKNKTVVKDANYAYQSSWLGKKSIESVHPNNKKQQKTLKRFNPPLPKVRANAIQVFLEYQEQFLTLLAEAEGININKVKVPVEFFKLLKLRLGDCIEFMVVHQQRHLQQALKVLTAYQATATTENVKC